MAASHFQKINLERSLLLRTLHQEGGVSWPELCKRYPMHSKRSIYRHATAVDRVEDKRKHNSGRPRKLKSRDERIILRTLVQLRKERASFSAKQIQEETKLFHVSLKTIYRVLHKHGYKYRQSRKKGLLSDKDKKLRLQYALDKRTLPVTFWQDTISFYFDGVGFAHRKNPYAEARAVSSMAWRKPGEELEITTKGRKEGSCGRMANYFVAISHGYGVVCCEQYKCRVTGESFAQFVTEKFKGEEIF